MSDGVGRGAPPTPPDLSGRLLGGRYRLNRRIGAGGMGEVYEAWQEDLRRPVAVKVLAAATLVPDSVSRFQREARAAAALGHAHIVQVHDFQTPAHEPAFLVMELLQAPSMYHVLRSGPMAAERVARIGRHVLDALAAAHDIGIVHRDIKPANIMLVPSSTLGEVAKVLDFGIAKLAGSSTGPLSTGGLTGTIAFMSPEQAQGLDVDGRSDIYSLAVCMYVALSGQRPFEADTPTAMLSAIISGQHAALGVLRPELDPWLVAIVERGLARNVADRYPDAHAMADELDAWLARLRALPVIGAPAAPAVTAPPPPPSPVYAPHAPMPVHAPLPVLPPPGAPHGHGAPAPRGITALENAPTIESTALRRRTRTFPLVLGVLAGGAVVALAGLAIALLVPLVRSNATEADASPPLASAPPATPTSSAVPVPTSATASVAPPSLPSSRSRGTPSAAASPVTNPVPPSPSPAPAREGGALGAACRTRAQCATPNATCMDGVCKCPSHLHACPSGCQDFIWDRQNCGGCAHACTTSEECDHGACIPCTFPLCNGKCKNLRAEHDNCGTCGHRCASDQLCMAGTCR